MGYLSNRICRWHSHIPPGSILTNIDPHALTESEKTALASVAKIAAGYRLFAEVIMENDSAGKARFPTERGCRSGKADSALAAMGMLHRERSLAEAAQWERLLRELE